MLAFGLTIFAGAFLLFLVQPLIAKFILPWFGGSPAVWTTCMLFFQMFLLAGYAYAHLSIRRLPTNRQVLAHLALLALALVFLPIAPSDFWKPINGTAPISRILLLLTVSIGLPYLVLSATSPLLQAWFSAAYRGVSPYRLYAVSNVGSLLALLGYPFLVEPNFSRQSQANWWSVGLAAFALMTAWCGWLVWRKARLEPELQGSPDFQPAPAEAGAPPEEGETAAKGRWLWFGLPACGSVLLLAITNTICHDIAVIPFLWVLPLSLYLLSFIISFDNPRWYWRPFWLPALALALLATFWMTFGASVPVPDHPLLRPLRWLHVQADALSMFKAIGIYLATLFVCCMVCHGEVYRLRPPARQLTGYYLTIAAGGAAGGFFVAIVAPALFKGYFELHAGLFALALLAAATLFLDNHARLRVRSKWAFAGTALALAIYGGGLFYDAWASNSEFAAVSRNFYGVIKVKESHPDDSYLHELTLQHGGTTHGLQYMADERRRMPTSYYTRSSGVGRVMKHFTREGGRRVGVVGLGTGTMAAWGRAGDTIRFYEIDRDVKEVALKRFAYLRESPAKIEIVQGDARLSLEREPPQRFDILVLDAFSSDAIPVHLLTREAFEIYRRHLQPDGVMVVHISNRYLNLEPVIRRISECFALRAAIVRDEGGSHDEEDGEEEEENLSDFYNSDWALLTKNKVFLEMPGVAEAISPPGEDLPEIKLWTDDDSNLFRILVTDEDGWLGWLRRL